MNDNHDHHDDLKVIGNGKTDKSVDRAKSAKLIDLHVFLMPSHLWARHQNTAMTEMVSEAISAGYIRVHPESVLHDVRTEIDEQLGQEVVPRDYVFIRPVGRCFSTVKAKQEMELKAKYFLPPHTFGPELYVLDQTAAFAGRSSTTDSSVMSLDLNDGRRHHKHNLLPSIADRYEEYSMNKHMSGHHGVNGECHCFDVGYQGTPYSSGFQIDDTYDADLERTSLLRELHRLRARREDLEIGRAALLGRARELRDKSTVNRNYTTRDMWKKRYYEEKKRTGPREEHTQALRRVLDQLNYKIIGQLEAMKDDLKRMPDADLHDHHKKIDRTNEKIHTTRLEQDIEDLQARLQMTKAKLTAETKLRTQSDYELQLLKANHVQRTVGLQYLPEEEGTQQLDGGHYEYVEDMSAQQEYDVTARPPGRPGRTFHVVRRADGSPELHEIAPVNGQIAHQVYPLLSMPGHQGGYYESSRQLQPHVEHVEIVHGGGDHSHRNGADHHGGYSRPHHETVRRVQSEDESSYPPQDAGGRRARRRRSHSPPNREVEVESQRSRHRSLSPPREEVVIETTRRGHRHERCLYPYDDKLDSPRTKVVYVQKTTDNNHDNHHKHNNNNADITKNDDGQVIKKKKKSKKVTALEQSFKSIASRTDGKGPVKASSTDVIQWCLDSGVLGRHLNSNQVDQAFARVKPQGKKYITSNELQHLIDEMAYKYKDDKMCDYSSARGALVEKLSGHTSATQPHSGSHIVTVHSNGVSGGSYTPIKPVNTPRPTKLSKLSVVDRLTDTSKFTGTHKLRFDETGKGLGIDGRENRMDWNGYHYNYEIKRGGEK